MAENKTSKYFKYAIGEIILVVIGILIALQINTWNEYRKDRKEEIRILTNLIIDLDEDISVHANDIATSSKRQTLMDSLYMALKSPELFSWNQFGKFNESILYEDLFNTQSATFDESMSDGSFKLIQNQTLRKSILDYYKKAKINKTDGHVSKLIYEMIYPTYYKTLARAEKIGSKKEIIAYLNQNEDYLAMVNIKYMLQNYQIGAWQTEINRAKQCKDKIETELKNYD